MATKNLTLVTRSEVVIVIETKGFQLLALLASMYGGGRDSFEDMGPENRDILVWLAHDLCADLTAAGTALIGMEA